MSDSEEYFIHSSRFPKNVAGPFYSLGAQTSDGTWCGECLSCMLPQAEAPDLLAPINDDNSDTYFIRQPQTEEEIERACEAAEVCCVSAIRYGGKNRKIIERLGPEYCDYEVLRNEETRIRKLPKKKWWQFWNKTHNI